MKRLITFAAVFALLSVADSAFAQRGDKANDKQGQGQQQDQSARRGGNDGQKGGGSGGRGGGQGQKGGGQGGGGGLFRLLDIDRDGNLSAKEIDGAVAALMKLDVNNDGILDAQELVVRGGGHGEKGGAAVNKVLRVRSVVAVKAKAVKAIDQRTATESQNEGSSLHCNSGVLCLRFRTRGRASQHRVHDV